MNYLLMWGYLVKVVSVVKPEAIRERQITAGAIGLKYMKTGVNAANGIHNCLNVADEMDVPGGYSL